jgi:hypothetical protein
MLLFFLNLSLNKFGSGKTKSVPHSPVLPYLSNSYAVTFALVKSDTYRLDGKHCLGWGLSSSPIFLWRKQLFLPFSEIGNYLFPFLSL